MCFFVYNQSVIVFKNSDNIVHSYEKINILARPQTNDIEMHRTMSVGNLNQISSRQVYGGNNHVRQPRNYGVRGDYQQRTFCKHYTICVQNWDPCFYQLYKF